MARIRSIHPEFWSDTKIGALSPLARLLFISLWNFADDHGVASASPRRILGESFENDESVSESMCRKLLLEIEAQGLIKPFQADEKSWYYINNWKKYQKIEKPTKRRNPPPPFSEISPIQSETFPKTVGENSPTVSGSESANFSETVGENFRNPPRWDKDKDKEEEEDKEKEKEKENPPLPPSGVSIESHPFFGNVRFREAWACYLEMRKRIRKPPTDKAKELALERLVELTPDAEAASRILDQSTFNSWQGVFPLKEAITQGARNVNGYSGPNQRKLEKNNREFAEELTL